jgi:3-methylcrotonyl-CoA carboxylase alpha subunit
VLGSLLIANRGEIACRIIRTARRLGIRTVAVFSDADAGARHVRLADEAIRIGAAPARDSYLDMARVLAAATASGVEAIHPGYGFLSENAAFAQACVERGLLFIGPPAQAIAAMGSKSAAKEMMRQAGVPVLPGYHGAAQDLATFEREARALGLPLIVKPSGGGGGKGMQIVSDWAQLPVALESAQRLARAAFADATLLIERYLPAPRHVEVQIFADLQGNVLHLFDRDCSVQRRHQKLIEEAPAPGIPPTVRAELHGAAIAVARAIGYVNAGTVEFLYSGNASAGDFWFMEMNTRLQVEHPVTEAVTGLELVEWQLRVASGESLPRRQEDLAVLGHAIEVRVCAEDPSAGFAPSAGRIEQLAWPVDPGREGHKGVRVDAGFEAGDVVPAHYDSLLGKVIAHAPTRDGAIARLIAALGGLRTAGIHTNVGWLRRAVASDAFRAGDVTTRFVEQSGDAFWVPGPERELAAAIAALGEAEDRIAVCDYSPWSAADAFRVNLDATQEIRLRERGEERLVRLAHRGAGRWSARIDNWSADIGWRAAAAEQPPLADARAQAAPLEITVAERVRHAYRLRTHSATHVWLDAEHYEFVVDDPREAHYLGEAAAAALTSSLPGVVVQVPVTIGQAVNAGEVLIVIEAMKMEHAIIAPRPGTVRKLLYAVGERVPEGAALVELDYGHVQPH